MIIVGLDQLVKFITVTKIPYETSVDFIPGILNLNHVYNDGAAFSIFQGQRLLFIFLFLLLTVGFIYEYKHNTFNLKPFEKWCLAAIYGGGLGNTIDRVRLGYVVDMLEFDFIKFPIFNVADCFITCGCCVLCFYIIFFHENFLKDILK